MKVPLAAPHQLLLKGGISFLWGTRGEKASEVPLSGLGSGGWSCRPKPSLVTFSPCDFGPLWVCFLICPCSDSPFITWLSWRFNNSLTQCLELLRVTGSSHCEWCCGSAGPSQHGHPHNGISTSCISFNVYKAFFQKVIMGGGGQGLNPFRPDLRTPRLQNLFRVPPVFNPWEWAPPVGSEIQDCSNTPGCLRRWLNTSYSDTEVSRQTIYKTDKSTTALWVKNPVVPTKCPFSLKYPPWLPLRACPGVQF